MKVLHIDSSLQGQSAISSGIAKKIIEKIDANADITYRNLNVDVIPHLTEARFIAFNTAEEERSPEQQAEVALSDTLITELTNSNAVVIGVPMYNFGVPSTLKAWFDHVARNGKTFSYTAEGPVALIKMPKVYIAATRGGIYANTEMDSQTQWLKQILGFIGFTDIEFVYAEGISMNGVEEAVAQATKQIDSLALA